MLIEGKNYAPSLVRFLNQFSKKCEKHKDQQNGVLENTFLSFLSACEDLPDNIFINSRNKRFNIALFEAVFAAAGKNAFADRRKLDGHIRTNEVVALAQDAHFLQASIAGTTRTANVSIRLKTAETIITPR